MNKRSRFLLAAILCLGFAGVANAQGTANAADIVRAVIDHWRGQTSYSEMTMTIHRPDWERSMTMQAWTKGDKHSLVRVTEPRKDRGNGTLMIDNIMWSYNPKVNRVIKIPSSLMNQGWMGSDFTNKDVSRSDEIVDQYEHTLLGTTEADGHVVYEIESVPHEEAAVVWGKEVLKVRDDYVVTEQAFYDQDGVLVKALSSLQIGEMGGRTVAIRQRMSKVDNPGEWTEVRLDAIRYDIELGDNVFTQSNLRNPRN